MRLLSNEQIEQLLSMPTCIDVLETMYADLGQQEAAESTRQDLLVSVQRSESVHAFKTMSGSWPRAKITALRLNSDILSFPNINGEPHRVKIPAAPGGRWVGLVLLFDTETGTPLAIFPDGVMQRTRVGGTSGVAIKHLSRNDSHYVGILGSGWQAGAQLEAVCAVRDIKRIKVFSPNSEHRRDFATLYSKRLGVPVEAVAEADNAADGVDILISATNSLVPTMRLEWLRPGMHITNIRGNEMPDAVLTKVERVVVHSNAPVEVHPTKGWPSLVPEIENGNRVTEMTFDWRTAVELSAVAAGMVPGRTNPEEITVFYNSMGLGLQFAALGSLVWKLAEAQQIGLELPSEYFTETVHP